DLDDFKTLMKAIGKLACKHIRGGSGMIDSIPIHAALHDRVAEFNPHYSHKMYKLHLFHYAQFPLAAIFSQGCAYDGDFVLPLSAMVQPMEPILKKILLDGGYDSYKIHADLWYKFRVHPLIAIRENAVHEKKGTEMRLNHWVNKDWREGSEINKPLLKKLEFLYEQGKIEQIGAYFRNINLENPHFQEKYKSRSMCERTHSHMKAMCNFTVHGCKTNQRNCT
ncbi:MAG: transposase, partial [Euryarchaeota archaeon]|nr:transposase [Euryarchaeota archaeon]